MKDLFGSDIQQQERPKVNKTAIQMHKDLITINGTHPGKCKDCVHFKIRNFGKKYFKCELASVSGSEKTDWRANWEACGKFILKVEEELADIPGRKEKFDSKAFDAEQDFLNKKTRQ